MLGPQMTLVPDTARPGSSPDAAMAGDMDNASALDGKTAPALTLADLNGNKVSLTNYKGGRWWSTSGRPWCGPCKVEIPWFEKLHEQYAKPRGWRSWASRPTDLDRDDPAKLFTQKRGHRGFRVEDAHELSGAAGEDAVEDKWGIDAMPTTFLHRPQREDRGLDDRPGASRGDRRGYPEGDRERGDLVRFVTVAVTFIVLAMSGAGRSCPGRRRPTPGGGAQQLCIFSIPAGDAAGGSRDRRTAFPDQRGLHINSHQPRQKSLIGRS